MHTPTGNLANPFFFGPLVLLQACCRPSIAVLRTVSLASGLLASGQLAALARVFDRRTAWVSTLALAVLPINIAYSRIAWDASQSLLATLPVLYPPWPPCDFRPGEIGSPGRHRELAGRSPGTSHQHLRWRGNRCRTGRAWRKRGLSQFGHHALHGRYENSTVPIGRSPPGHLASLPALCRPPLGRLDAGDLGDVSGSRRRVSSRPASGWQTSAS